MTLSRKVTKTFVFIVLGIFLLSSLLVVVTFLSPASVTTETTTPLQQDGDASKQHQGTTGDISITGNEDK